MNKNYIIKHKQLNIGDIVLIEEKYNKNCHYLKNNRLHVGFIFLLDDSGNIGIIKKKLISPKQPKIINFKDILKIFYSIGLSNYGYYSHTIINESDIVNIDILKTAKKIMETEK